MHVAKYTEAFRKEELERGSRSLWYFGQSIIGFGDLSEPWGEVQYDLCATLEARDPHPPWRRLVVSVYRDGFKSSITTQAYPWWRALYIPGFTVKMIENSSDNAKLNHFKPMVDLFMSSPRADYLCWLYRHRIPAGFEGWNSQQVQLLKGADPFSAPTITYWGLESKKEGTHVDLVILDDADGADADKSPERNLDAYEAYRASIPLLKNPRKGQILVVGTPHGPDPLVYQLRDRELNGALDNSRRRVKVFWRPLVRDDGTIEEPNRFPPSLIEELKMDPETWNTQYMLRRPGKSLQLFDMERVRESYYSWLDPEQTVIRYRGYEMTKEAIDAFREGEPLPELAETEETVAVSECYAFLTFDPTHRYKQVYARNSRPSEMAILATLVSPDCHVFVYRYWTKDCDINEAIHELLRLYRITGALAVSWETVGAQVWLKQMIENMERSIPSLRKMECVGGAFERRPLPPLSQRLVEFDRGQKSKADLYRSNLSHWVNSGLLHLPAPPSPYHGGFYDQLENVLNEKREVDLVDCAAQGPAIWKAPPAPDTIRRFRQRRAWAERRTRGQKTPLRSPWTGNHPADPSDLEDFGYIHRN